MRVVFSRKADKDLERLDAHARLRVLAKIRAYADDPAALSGNVKALAGIDAYRLRVGDYRVVFEIQDGKLTVMVVRRVRHRRNAYD